MNTRGCLVVKLVLLVLAVTHGPVLAQSLESAQVDLARPLPLKLAYPVGEILHYRLDRRALSYAVDGRRVGEVRSVAFFTRTRLPDHPELGVQEELAWDWFEHGQSLTDAPAEPRPFEPAEGFTLVFHPNTADALERLDYSGVPATMDGFNFMIMTWDVFSFDGLARPNPHFPFPDSASVGEIVHETRGPHDFRFEFPPLVTDSRYSFSGQNRARILGVSTLGGEPSVIVEFSGAENPLEMTLNYGPFPIKVTGFEHLWGKSYLSLRDGRIVRGELAVHNTIVVQGPGVAEGEPLSLSEASNIGDIQLQLLSPEEYERQRAARFAAHSLALVARGVPAPSPGWHPLAGCRVRGSRPDIPLP